jgi:hypothetical protein
MSQFYGLRGMTWGLRALQQKRVLRLRRRMTRYVVMLFAVMDMRQRQWKKLFRGLNLLLDVKHLYIKICLNRDNSKLKLTAAVSISG